MQKPPVVVSTSAYGADFVRDLGQEHVLPFIAAADADGVEIRRELFASGEPALPTLRAAIAGHALFAIYSVPLELWRADGHLAADELSQALAEAASVAAGVLKVSLGHYATGSGLAELGAMLAASPVRLLVENDQTLQGGTLAPLATFFAACRDAGLPVGMTFDIGNWCWTGTDPEAAARALGAYVEYVHCKQVVSEGGKLKAVPPAGERPDWAACFAHFRSGLPRAIEFPLLGASLAAVTRQHVARLRML